jgi:hypothetical protein
MKSRRALSLSGPALGAAGAGAGCAARCRGMGRLTALGGAAFTGGGVAITGRVSCAPASSLPAALCDAVRGGSGGAAVSTGGVPGGVTESGIRARPGNGSDGVAAVVSGLAGGEAAGAAAGCDSGSAAAGGLRGGTADAGSDFDAAGVGAGTDLAEADGAGTVSLAFRPLVGTCPAEPETPGNGKTRLAT